MELEDIKIVFEFWAMSVLDKHKAVREVYYKKTAAVILVFDVTQPDSFYNLPNWLEEIWKSMGTKPMVLIGNNKNLRDNKNKLTICTNLIKLNIYSYNIRKNTL